MSIRVEGKDLPQNSLIVHEHGSKDLGEVSVQENGINEVASRVVVHQEPMALEDVQPLDQHVVIQEPLQQSVHQTKNHERRLVFDTLARKGNEVLDSYEDMNKLKGRLKNEIFQSTWINVEDSYLDEIVGDAEHPKYLEKGVLAQKLQEDLGISEGEARRIAGRVCFVGKKHLASDMRTFKKLLAAKVIGSRKGDGIHLNRDEKRQLEKQIKKLNLGKDPRNLSSERLSGILRDQGIVRAQHAKGISRVMCEQTKFDQLPLLRSDLNSMHTFKNKLFHNVMKQRAKEGYTLSKGDVKALKQKIDMLDLGDNPKRVSSQKLSRKLYNNGIAGKKMSESLAKATTKEFQGALRNLDKHATELARTAQKLNQLLGTKPEDADLKKVNSQVISLLRDAFNNKAYLAMKHNDDNPTIHYLHQLNLAMYTETALLDAYISPTEEETYLGDRLVQGHEDKPLGEAIQDIRDDAVQNRGLFSSHSCIKYIVNHFQQFWGAFTSQKVGSPFGDYDPHGDLGNNAGTLYEETLDVNGTEGKAIDVRTPSPTIGNKVAPEFRAALQAIENQRISESMGAEGYGRPNCWIYTNYQDITNEWNGEHGRSKAIMELNEDFPLAFRGITLSKDSAYFKDGIGHGEGEHLWESIDHDAIFDMDAIPDFVEEMKEKLTDDANFTLNNRTRDKGAKLYFPARNEQEVKDYKRALVGIADQTGRFLQDVVQNNGYSGKNAWMIKAAAKEFAYAAIQKYIQAKELASLEGKGLKPVVITSSVCKEDIDRGFSDHTKRMYMLGAGEETFLAKIVNLPALMARYRVILNDRIQPMIAVANYVDRDVAKNHLNTAVEDLGVTSVSATPYTRRVE